MELEQKEVYVVFTNNEENTTNTENTDTFGTEGQTVSIYQRTLYIYLHYVIFF